MISKIPTYALKKIKITKSSFVLVVLLFVITFSFLFFKIFETLVILGLFYFISLPIGFIHFLKLKKKYDKNKKNNNSLISDEII